VEEGIVPGGGVALLRGAGALAGVKLPSDEQIGVDVVKRACEEPLRQIVGNAGFEAHRGRARAHQREPQLRL